MISIRAIFFDLDGTLFNSMPFHAQAWEETMHRHGLRLNAMDTYLNEGRTGTDVIREAFEHKGETRTDEEIRAIYKEKTEAFHRLCPDGAQPLDGVPQLMQWLSTQSIQCWIVTGSGQQSNLERIVYLFPQCIAPQRMITAFDVTHGKPHPEPYLKAWERSGMRKNECIVIENAPLGVRAAKAAGLFTIAVNTGILPDQVLADEHADVVLPDINALLNWLKSQTS